MTERGRECVMAPGQNAKQGGKGLKRTQKTKHRDANPKNCLTGGSSGGGKKKKSPPALDSTRAQQYVSGRIQHKTREETDPKMNERTLTPAMEKR